MHLHTYRRAKQVDGCLQVATFFLTLLLGGEGGRSGGWIMGLFLCYFTVGGAQFLSWLIWLFATPRTRSNTGRALYTGGLLFLAVVFAASYFSGHGSRLDSAVPLMIFSPFLAVGYVILTFVEGRRDRAESSS